MAVNRKEADSEHVLSSISEMTSVIGSSITQRKFQIYSLQMQITARFQLQSLFKN